MPEKVGGLEKLASAPAEGQKGLEEFPFRSSRAWEKIRERSRVCGGRKGLAFKLFKGLAFKLLKFWSPPFQFKCLSRQPLSSTPPAYLK